MKEGYALIDDDDDSADVPTEEMIEKEEDKLDEIQKAQKNLFLIIFQVCLLRSLFIIGSCW